MLTNIVRAGCVLVDAAVLTAAAVGLVRFHRRGIGRLRAGRPVAEPRSNVIPLQRGRA